MAQKTFQSLAQAVETYYEELLRFAQQRTGSDMLAEDVIQDAWIRATKTSVAMPDNPRAYLYRMVGNLTVDHIRRRRVIAKVETSELQASNHSNWGGGDWPEQKTQQVAASLAPAIEDIVVAQQELVILTNAVQELPEQCRRVFLLYRGNGLTMREVALQLDISIKTVEKHIARAMLHCRKKLREAGRDV